MARVFVCEALPPAEDEAAAPSASATAPMPRSRATAAATAAAGGGSNAAPSVEPGASPGRIDSACITRLSWRKLKLKTKLESRISCFSFKRLGPGGFSLGFHRFNLHRPTRLSRGIVCISGSS